MIKTAILTISDKASRGERKDRSGSAIEEEIKRANWEVASYEIIPDEKGLIEKKLKELSNKVDLILTTGGTGISYRDVTPEATKNVIEKELSGFGEIMRQRSYEITKYSIISRAVAGTCGKTLIVNLPGSPKACKECLSFIIDAIPHTIELLKQETVECGRR